MPRRLPVRPGKILGNVFVLLVAGVMSFVYYTYVSVWGPRASESIWVMLMLVVFNLIVVMLVWSFIQTMTTDPGQVPVFWGFHLGDPEQKRRRYCLMCNIFKPERCHHCSVCNRCVLNMDHHCPWINNCVGFWNRKYFLLLLIYVLTCTYFVTFSLLWDWLKSIQWGLDEYYYNSNTAEATRTQLAQTVQLQVAFMLNGIIMVLITMFLRFHIHLALTNKTTIENLDKKGEDYISLYDIGSKSNWEQIFGMNKLLWPFPVFCGSGKPLGDGIYWPTNRNNEESARSQGGRSASNDVNRKQATPIPAANQNGAAFNQSKQNSSHQSLIDQGIQHFGQPQTANVHVQYVAGQHAPSSQALQPNQKAKPSSQQQELNVQIYENNQRAAQLAQQLNKQKSSSQNNKPQQKVQRNGAPQQRNPLSKQVSADSKRMSNQ